MFDRENPYELQFLPGESCFKSDEDGLVRDEVTRLHQTIAAAQKKLKELRTKEASNDEVIKSLKGELQKKSASLVPNSGYSVDFAILLDSEGIFYFSFHVHFIPLYTLISLSPFLSSSPSED